MITSHGYPLYNIPENKLLHVYAELAPCLTIMNTNMHDFSISKINDQNILCLPRLA